MQISNIDSAPTRCYTTPRNDAGTCTAGLAGVSDLAGVEDSICSDQRVAEAAVTSTFLVADMVGLPADRALSDPSGPCLSWPGGSFDNSEFAAAVAATAQTMRAQFRIGHGSVVGVLLRNVPEVITTMFATWSLGAALTPIDPALTGDEVSFQLDDSGAEPLLFGGSVHVLPQFDPETFWDVFEEERPTCFSAVPTIYSALAATTPTMDPGGRFLDAGEVGEVVISGQAVMKGNLGRSEATAKALRDGWLHTGDVGFLNEDGFLTLVDGI